MSDQLTSQSRSNESGITRRTALRGAAWSASAVTVVVATPNIAPRRPVRRRRQARAVQSRAAAGTATSSRSTTTLKNTGTTAFTSPTCGRLLERRQPNARRRLVARRNSGDVPAAEAATIGCRLDNVTGGTVDATYYADAPSVTPLVHADVRQREQGQRPSRASAPPEGLQELAAVGPAGYFSRVVSRLVLKRETRSARRIPTARGAATRTRGEDSSAVTHGGKRAPAQQARNLPRRRVRPGGAPQSRRGS